MSFKTAIKVEHEIQWICNSLHTTGFAFDYATAVGIADELTLRLAELDAKLSIPPKIKTTQLKTKVKTEVIEFNPNSPKQLVEYLTECGWNPVDKTQKGAWKVNEKNLATLPADAPEGARRIVERGIVASRLRKLKEWFDVYNAETGRIHGTFIGLGTWTHRLTHRHPNMANIAAEKSIKYKSEELARIATEYGKRFRSLWRASEGRVLVGTDADGIQLRIFAHYINDPGFTRALLEGKKELGTDAHSVNARILGVDRDTAKTFIYAFLLGAGDRKLGEILGLETDEARSTKRRFIESYPGLSYLKQKVIPADAAKGYFQGLDGRYVVIPGTNVRDREHLALSGYLQNGEAVVMKHANIRWRNELHKRGIPFEQVNFVHDEWQTEVSPDREMVTTVGDIQSRSIMQVGEELELRCRLGGNHKSGENWWETH